MKKYEKPRIIIERYELSKHIANCFYELNSGNPESCAADPDDNSGASLFTNSDICVIVVSTDNTDYEDYCYFNSTDEFRTFQS